MHYIFSLITDLHNKGFNIIKDCDQVEAICCVVQYKGKQPIHRILFHQISGLKLTTNRGSWRNAVQSYYISYQANTIIQFVYRKPTLLRHHIPDHISYCSGLRNCPEYTFPRHVPLQRSNEHNDIPNIIFMISLLIKPELTYFCTAVHIRMFRIQKSSQLHKNNRFVKTLIMSGRVYTH